MVDAATGNLAVRDVSSGAVRNVTTNPPGSKEFAYFSVVSADSRRIAYSWFNNEGFYELRVASVDGRVAPVVLHRNEERRFVQPCAWSRDGSQILTLFFRNDNVSQIALVNSADGSVKVLKSLDWIYPNKMDLSSDGKWIVYDDLIREGSTQRSIYLLATDGSKRRALLKDPVNEVFPLFAPDGDRVVYLKQHGELYEQALNGGDPKKLAGELGRALPLGITKAGTYFYALRSGESEVFVAPTNGKPQSAGAGIGDPEWSVDGKSLAFLSRAANENFGQDARVIVIRELESGKVKLVTPRLPYIDRIRWSPDGKTFLAGGSDRHGQRGLYSINVETSEVSPVVREPASSYQGYEGVWAREGFCYIDGSGTLRYRPDKGEEQKLFQAPAGATLEKLAAANDGRSLAVVARTAESSAVFAGTIDGIGWKQIANVRGGSLLGLDWSSNGSLLASVPSDPPSVWKIAREGGTPQKLDYKLGQSSAVRMHPNGQWMAYSAGKTQTEIWMLEGLWNAAHHER